MSRIVSQVLRTGEVHSSTQLQLDAAVSSFSAQATDSFAIASMTAAGLMGRAARLGILSISAQQAFPLLNIFSHLGSVGAEAAIVTLLQKGSFSTHCLNFSMFRLAGGLGISNPLGQFVSQSATMVAAHQVASAIGLEEKSQQSLAQQFFQAGLSTFQIQIGSHFAHVLGSGRIQILERNLEGKNQFFANNANNTRNEITRFASEPPRERFDTDPLLRISQAPAPAAINTSFDPKTFKTELGQFVSNIDNTTSMLVAVINSSWRAQTRGYDILTIHASLCGPAKGIIGQVERNGRMEGVPNLTGLLADRFQHFSTGIGIMETTAGTPTPETLSMRNKLYEAYDNLHLLREATRIISRNAPETDRIYYFGVGLAYRGLKGDAAEQAKQIRTDTHSNTLPVHDEEVKRWSETFLRRTQNPQVARNAQVIRGRIPLVRGEYVGGSFYRALQEAPLNKLLSRPVRIICDYHSGQILAFRDGSEAARKCITMLEGKPFRLQEATLWVDTVETGEIVHVDLHGNNSHSTAHEALEGLVGFQVMPANRIWAFENWAEPTQNYWSISFAWNTCDQPTSQLYSLRISKAIDQGNGENTQAWRLFTLEPAMIGSEAPSLQLWVPNHSVHEDMLKPLVKVIKIA